MTRRDAAVALALLVATLVVLAWGVDGRTLYNGDEAIYAGYARDLRTGGDWLHLRYDGAIIHQRPPLFVWLLALAGGGELALRLPAMLSMAGCASLTFLIGRRLVGWPAAALAGALLPTLALPFIYGRQATSDATLTLFCLAAVYFWLEARERPRLIYAAGAALGLALMTKQIVGALPLVLLVPWLGGKLPPRRELLRAAGVAAAVAAPWHVYMLAAHGRAFVDGYLGYQIVRRTATTVLAPTTWSYYFEVLWDKEGWVVLAALVGGAGYCLWRRREGDRLLLVWPALVIGLFSLVSTRIDYYLLPAYPFMALIMVAPLERLRARAAIAVGAALVATSFALHVPQRATAPDPFAELRAMSRLAGSASPPGTPLYCFDVLYLVPRYYSGRPTVMVVTDQGTYDRYTITEPFAFASSLVYAPSSQASALLGEQPRWTALIDRRIKADKLAEKLGAVVLGESPHYVLLGKLTD